MEEKEKTEITEEQLVAAGKTVIDGYLATKRVIEHLKTKNLTVNSPGTKEALQKIAEAASRLGMTGLSVKRIEDALTGAMAFRSDALVRALNLAMDRVEGIAAEDEEVVSASDFAEMPF